MQDAIDDRQGRAAASRPSRPPGSSAPDTSDPDAAERRTFVTAEIDRMQKEASFKQQHTMSRTEEM